MKKYFIVILFFLLFLIGCEIDTPNIQPLYIYKESETPIPPYLDTGANTLVYVVEDRIVHAKNERDTTSPLIAMYYKSLTTHKWTFLIEATTSTKNNYQSLVISLENVLDTGIYVTGESDGGNYYNVMKYIKGRTDVQNSTYLTTLEQKGYVHIKKLDTVNLIASGTFYFSAKLFLWGTDQDTLQISKGQFDVKLFDFE